MAKFFDYKSAINYGWNTTKNNFGFLTGTSFIAGVLVFTGYVIANLTKGDVLLNFTFSVGAKLLHTIIFMGFIKITLKMLNWEKPKFIDLFSCIHLIFKSFFASLIYYLIVFVGLIFLFIPGIYIAVKYQFYEYFIVDKEYGPIKALNESSKITEGVKWELIKLNIVCAIIDILGFLFLFFGLVVAVPITVSAKSYAYKTLVAKMEKSDLLIRNRNTMGSF